MQKNHYLYRHIRLDTNQPFYIGIGTKRKHFTSEETEYSRAYDLNKRNVYWKNIVNKTNYKVEILLESKDYSFIKQKEIEFIKLYGRKNKKTGILCNMTDGGEGSKGVVTSNYTRFLKSIKMKNRVISKESIEKRIATMQSNGYYVSQQTKDKMAIVKSKKVIQLSLEGVYIKEWLTPREAAKYLKVNHPAITQAANIKNIKNYTAYNYLWIYTEDYKNKNLSKIDKAKNLAKIGKIKTYITSDIKEKVKQEFINLQNINYNKKEKINYLCKTYNLGFSTIRALVYDLK